MKWSCEAISECDSVTFHDLNITGLWPLGQTTALIWTKANEKFIVSLISVPPSLSSSCLQRCQSVHSMRSGGSCWSWLWWDSSSFWSWSSLYCCMDTATNTKPAAQVCHIKLYMVTVSCVEIYLLFFLRAILAKKNNFFSPHSLTHWVRSAQCRTTYCTFCNSEKLRHASVRLYPL